MADLQILAGSTGQSINLNLSILSTGAPQTGLTYASAGLTAYYSFTGANATSTAITLVTLATVTTAYASGGFIEIDPTNMPGVYRLDLPTGVLAASKGREVFVTINGYAGMAPTTKTIELTGIDNQNSSTFGISSFSAMATSSALSTVQTTANTISSHTSGLTFTVSNKVDANLYDWKGTAVPTPATLGIPDINVKNIDNAVATTPGGNQNITQTFIAS